MLVAVLVKEAKKNERKKTLWASASIAEKK